MLNGSVSKPTVSRGAVEGAAASNMFRDIEKPTGWHGGCNLPRPSPFRPCEDGSLMLPGATMDS